MCWLKPSMRLLPILVASGALTLAFAAGARDAEACGGCFPPAGEQPSIVTDHRMIFPVSKEQTTIYDQIQYTGAPSEFAWVLPISGTVEIALSADMLFGALHNLTAVAVQEPPRNCPPAPNCGYQFGAESDNAPSPTAGAGGSSSSGGVQVITKETVGPYETVQLESENATALNDWLANNIGGMTAMVGVGLVRGRRHKRVSFQREALHDP